MLLNRHEIDKIEQRTRVQGPDDHPAGAVLQGRPGEGRDRAGARQEGVRQAPRHRRARRARASAEREMGRRLKGIMTWQDADLAAYLERLGCPGIVDVHVHFMAPPVHGEGVGVLRRRRAEARSAVAGPLPRRATRSGRDAALAGRGAFPRCPTRTSRASLVHERLGAGFAARTPDVRALAPRSSPSRRRPTYVPAAIADGVGVFKAHLQVGEFAADDPLLDPVWARDRAGAGPGRAARRLRPDAGRAHGPARSGDGAGAVPAAARW